MDPVARAASMTAASSLRFAFRLSFFICALVFGVLLLLRDEDDEGAAATGRTEFRTWFEYFATSSGGVYPGRTLRSFLMVPSGRRVIGMTRTSASFSRMPAI